MMSRHANVRDLIPLGGYVAGADPATDHAVQTHDHIEAFLCQRQDEAASRDATLMTLKEIAA